MVLELSPFAYAVAASLLLLIEEVDMGYSIGDGVEMELDEWHPVSIIDTGIHIKRNVSNNFIQSPFLAWITIFAYNYIDMEKHKASYR